AHTVNFKTGNFEKIWRDVAPLVQSGDLSFANIEAPVCDSVEWSTYPQFNMHREYVDAAVKAGFNVFSLANNHTNDQYLTGIRATKKLFDGLKGTYACGLRDSSNGPMSHKLIEKNGWKVLFVAVTELLNRPDYASYIDYYPSTEKKRSELKENLKSLREANSCDLFVLSIHTDEVEYVQKVTENHRNFYRELIENCGVDIVWANHPHVVKPWETIELKEAKKENGLKAGFVMYANGNTISGQRTSPNFYKAETERDLTGDGFIIKIEAKKTHGKVVLEKIEPHFITTYINPSWQFVIKHLDDDLIHSLERSDFTNWADYLKKHKSALENCKDLNESRTNN
ncbi:MAG: CapA family protein, partial [Treponema sp.]|nr:CapA family protein [Candidatus Treponema equifaecale]